MTDRELQDLGIGRCDIERVTLTGKALWKTQSVL
jgi:uncharacterized protein YjiS (DUF1127 family)